MTKYLPLLGLVLLTATAPAVAAKSSGEGSVHGQEAEIHANTQVQVSALPSCDPVAVWNSHGAYVSCIAKEHLGGAITAVAGESNISKHEDNSSGSGEESPSPSPSTSVSPSGSPTPTSSESASPSASVTASVNQSVNIELRAVMGVLQNILKSLHQLI